MTIATEVAQATHAYVGYCQGCGHMTAASVDYPSGRRDTAKFVADLLRDGYRVERVPIERCRAELHICTCVAPEPAQEELFGSATEAGAR